MKTTQNYQLPQWEATDPLRREDFNAAMAALDAGLETKAAQPAYVVGSYTGNGAAQDIPLGFMPRFLLIRLGNTSLMQTDCYTNFAVTGGVDPYVTLLLTESGFQVIYRENVGSAVNAGGHVYVYAAFR